MTNSEIETQLLKLVRHERQITNEILSLINLADARNLYAEKGYSSLFEWLTQAFGYSESAAQRRIQAARLLRAVPEVAPKIASGEVNLTTLAKAQSVIRLQERVSGQKLSHTEKAQVVGTIENKSGAETEKTLLKTFPLVASKVHEERTTVINDDITRLAVNLPNSVLDNLKRAQELLSHTLPGGSLVDVIEYLIKDFIKRKDPCVKNCAKLNEVDKKSKATSISVLVEPNNSEDSGSKIIVDESRIFSGSNLKGATFRPKKREQRTVQPAASFAKDKPKSVQNTAATKRRVTGLSGKLKREVLARSQGRCTYKDFSTGRVCGSSYMVEVDHIYPRALGGEDSRENLRCLCRRHNQLVAQQALGISTAQHWQSLLR